MKPPKEYADFTAIIDGELFRAWIETLATLTDEVKLVVDRSGFHVKSVDPAHVAMIEAKLKRPSFTKLVVSQAGSIGIDLDKLNEVLQSVKKGDEVKLETIFSSELEEVEGKSKKARVWTQKIQTQNGTITRQFLPVNTNCMSEPKIPQLNLGGRYTITFEMFEQAIKQCNNVSDYVVMMMSSKKKLYLNAEGENDTLVNEIDYDLLEGKVIGRSKDYRSLFPLDYVYYIVKQGKFGMKRLLKKSNITINMDNDYPLKMEASNDGHWEITYLLAPRIESE